MSSSSSKPRLQQRHLHDLKFMEGKVAVPHGVLMSFNDHERKIARELTIQGLVKFEQFGAAGDNLAALPWPFVLLGAPQDKDVKGKNKKLHEYLADNAHRCAKVFLDSSGTVGLMQAFSKGDAARTGCPVGYRVYVLDKNDSGADDGDPAAKVHKTSNATFSSSSSSSSSSGGAGGVPKRGQEQLAAMDHYNDNLKRDRTARHQSQIFHMRNLNNCVKSCALRDAVQSQPARAMRVIDFGCGMGGDIGKWVKTCPHGMARYVGIDIAVESLRSFASARLDVFKDDSCRVVTHLICADVSTESLSDPGTQLETHTWTAAAVSSSSKGSRGKERSVTGQWVLTGSPLCDADLFDVASCQFALHYMFQTRAKADFFFAQVGRHLRKGGVFVATTTDCRVLREMIAKQECGLRADDVGDNNDENDSANGGHDSMHRLRIKNPLGSTLLNITFAEEHWKRMLGRPGVASKDCAGDDDDAFGVQYDFNLLDSADASQAAVNAPEWMVPLGGPLDRLAARHGLRVKSVQNFHDFVKQREGDWSSGGLGQLMDELAVFNYQGSVGAAEWAIARCYCVLVFEKAQGGEDARLDKELEAFRSYSAPRSAHQQQGAPPAAHPPPTTQVAFSSPAPGPGFVPFVAPTAAGAAAAGAAPASGVFAPTSPEGPPPSFAPTSPEGPPPAFAPTSPEGPPPSFAPTSPEGPPPSFAPTSPEGPPPSFAPTSPEGPPPDAMPMDQEPQEEEEEEEDDDPFMLFLIRTRARAVQRAGGERRWDALSDAARDDLMEACRLALTAEGHAPEGM